MNHYDFILAGGGLAGLSLTHHLLHSPLGNCSILIVDQSAKNKNDRTIAYWADRPMPFDDIAYRSWDHLLVAGKDYRRRFELGKYRYKMIRGPDLYQHTRERFSGQGNIEFRQGRVENIVDGYEEALVTIDGETVSGRWVFDSCYRPGELSADPDRYHYLKLHFWGWLIETPTPVFDPQVPTLMDFRTPQDRFTRFFYLLPFSERLALVEYTIFSAVTLSRADYESAIKNYVERVLQLNAYQVRERESGCIPITDQPFPRQIGRRVMTIGTKGGRIKPTTGYAFTRIQRDSAAIVRSLIQNGHPFNVPPDPPRFRLCDSILLEIMGEKGAQIEPIFASLFKRNSIGRIFRFLDEVASPAEHAFIIPTLPPRPFLEALYKMSLYKRHDHNHPLLIST